MKKILEKLIFNRKKALRSGRTKRADNATLIKKMGDFGQQLIVMSR